jgi:two-component system response regulator AtoC
MLASNATPDPSRQTILIGEDESEVRGFLDMTLRCQGYQVELAEDGEEVLAHLRAHPGIHAVLLDIMMPTKDGMETLREIRQIDGDLPVLMLSGLATPLNIVEAMKFGATDFLAKPITHEHLRNALRKALDTDPRATIATSRISPPPVEASQLRTSPAKTSPAQDVERPLTGMFYGSHAKMREIRAVVRKIAASDCPVIIQGETGSGKEMLARELHDQSPRAAKPFLKLNCAAVPSELMESELFGYERGAFTGAYHRKAGIFELSNGGTLLLDEIGDMDLRLQAKLLQVLQDHEFRRLGGRETVHVEVRVIAATHRDLEQALLDNSFRQDLFYRLNVFSFHLPPLRHRTEDLPGIADFLLKKYSQPDQIEPMLTSRLLAAFADYEWPGNIRELENVIRKLTVLRDPELILADLARNRRPRTPVTLSGEPHEEAQPASPSILEHVRQHNDKHESEAILTALQSTRWNRKQAAAMLKIEYKALLYRMKKLGIGSN